VKPGGRKEGDEATHKGARGEGEGGALLRRVLVAGVVEATESGLGYRAPRSVPAQPLEALPVVAVHRGVRVQGEALQHRDAPRARARSRSLDEAQALLRGSLLQLLVLVLWPRRLEVRPVLLRRAQHAGQNAGHLFVAGRRHRHHRPVGLPHPLSHEQMEVGRQLELTSEPLPEADCTARQRARRAVTPGFAALLPPHGQPRRKASCSTDFSGARRRPSTASPTSPVYCPPLTSPASALAPGLRLRLSRPSFGRR
jgi:hypothetical protein